MNELANIREALNTACVYVQDAWKTAVMDGISGAPRPRANKRLREQYAASIMLDTQTAAGGTLSQKVITEAQVAEDLEHGKPPWDMKPMLLNGPKARVGKNGNYNIIPFRHGTSSDSGSDSNFKAMPQSVYSKARALKASIKTANGTKWGGRLPAQGPRGQSRTAALNTKTGKVEHYQHSNNIHEGMVRVEKSYQGAKQSQYMTFRRVSDKSASNSWYHPGYEAHNTARNVARVCQPVVEEMLRDAAEKDLTRVVTSMGLM